VSPYLIFVRSFRLTPGFSSCFSFFIVFPLWSSPSALFYQRLADSPNIRTNTVFKIPCAFVSATRFLCICPFLMLVIKAMPSFEPSHGYHRFLLIFFCAVPNSSIFLLGVSCVLVAHLRRLHPTDFIATRKVPLIFPFLQAPLLCGCGSPSFRFSPPACYVYSADITVYFPFPHVEAWPPSISFGPLVVS